MLEVEAGHPVAAARLGRTSARHHEVERRPEAAGDSVFDRHPSERRGENTRQILGHRLTAWVRLRKPVIDLSSSANGI